MNIDEKMQYVGISLQPWTDGKELYESAWISDGKCRWRLLEDTKKDWSLVDVDFIVKNHKPIKVLYAVGVVLDQTYGYLTEWGESTIHHEEAAVLDNIKRARAYKKEFKGDFIEAVPDLNEFRNREDTW